jgi:hypothetical protein
VGHNCNVFVSKGWWFCITLLVVSLGFSQVTLLAQANVSGKSQAKTKVLGNCKHLAVGEAVPSLIHVRQFTYPGISGGEWQDEILVSS